MPARRLGHARVNADGQTLDAQVKPRDKPELTPHHRRESIHRRNACEPVREIAWICDGYNDTTCGPPIVCMTNG
jgi:hypothetical protein